VSIGAIEAVKEFLSTGTHATARCRFVKLLSGEVSFSKRPENAYLSRKHGGKMREVKESGLFK
jgi:hypothetical protein